MTVVSDEEGLAVILALLITSLLAGLGVTLLLVSDAERRFSANARGDQALRYAADAALERAIADLEVMADWSPILAGGLPSSFTDVTHRPVLPSGQTLDLDALTSDLQAGAFGGAGFGANTPVWRLFAFGPVTSLDASGTLPASQYLAVWVADDLSEQDDSPLGDSNGILTLHAEAFGPDASRREVEAVVERVHGLVGIISWREL